jgi:MFS family permease
MQLLKDKNWLRWTVLFMVSMGMFADYYFYDVSSTLKRLMEANLGFTSSNYGFFVALYSFPNMVMAVLGGIINDKIGVRRTGVIFISFMALGALVTAYGASDYFNSGGLGYDWVAATFPNVSASFPVMSLGFFMFGLGAETSIVVVTVIVVKWFKGRELATAMAVNVALARLGTGLSLVVSPSLVGQGISVPFYSGAVLLSLSLLAFVVYITMDKKLDNQLSKKEAEQVAAGEKEKEEDEEFRFSDLGKLLMNRSFLYITMLCVTFYAVVLPFMKYAPDLLQNKWGMDEQASGFITSILPFGTIIFTPLFGLFIDNKGKSATLMIFGSILLILVNLTFGYTDITPYIPMFVLGIAFSLIPSAMWPAVSKIVSEKRLGTAYGMMFSIQQIGVFLIAIIVGWSLDATNPDVTPEAIKQGATYDYTVPMLILTLLGLFGVLFAILLKINDRT